MDNPLTNIASRPNIVKGVGDVMTPAFGFLEQKVMNIPIWAFGVAGLTYLLWKQKPGFGLGRWVKDQVQTWGD